MMPRLLIQKHYKHKKMKKKKPNREYRDEHIQRLILHPIHGRE